MAALNQAIDRFQHNARKAADEKHPEQLVKRHALREVRLLPFAVVNLRVGRRRRQNPQLLFLSAVVFFCLFKAGFHLVDQVVERLQSSGQQVALLAHDDQFFANLGVKRGLLRVVHPLVRGQHVHLPAQFHICFVILRAEPIHQLVFFFLRHGFLLPCFTADKRPLFEGVSVYHASRSISTSTQPVSSPTRKKRTRACGARRRRRFRLAASSAVISRSPSG